MSEKRLAIIDILRAYYKIFWYGFLEPFIEFKSRVYSSIRLRAHIERVLVCTCFLRLFYSRLMDIHYYDRAIRLVLLLRTIEMHTPICWVRSAPVLESYSHYNITMIELFEYRGYLDGRAAVFISCLFVQRSTFTQLVLVMYKYIFFFQKHDIILIKSRAICARRKRS